MTDSDNAVPLILENAELKERIGKLEAEDASLREQLRVMQEPVSDEEILANFVGLERNEKVGDWPATFASIIAARTQKAEA